MKEDEDREPPLRPEEAAYFRTIEERFCALRGAPMLLSPRDWALIAEWWAEKVPLLVVLEAVEDVFAARARRGDGADRINSLTYARSEVLRRWRLHREMTAPRRGEPEETARLVEGIRRHLGRVSRALRQAAIAARDRGREELARTLLVVSAELRQIRKQASTEAWDALASEASLERLDSEVLESARRALEAEDASGIERETSAFLEPRREAMTPGAFRESRSAIESRLIRRHFGIPRISLLGEG